MLALATSGQDAFQTFFEQVRVGLALSDLDTRYIRVNDEYARLIGRRPEDLIGLSFTEVLHVGGQQPSSGELTELTELLEGRQDALPAEQRYLGPDGRELWVLHGVTVVRDEHGGPMWFAASAQDITERRLAELSLYQLNKVYAERAVRDPLTGLANRALLEGRLRGALSKDARSGSRTGLLFLDLDGFKQINDEHGHHIGDAVLRAVADRLTGGVRPSDTVGRLGGDEFVVLVEDVAENGLAPLVRRLEHAVRQPLVLGSHRFEVGVSIGTAVSARGEHDPASLLAAADGQMYAVKRARHRR